MCGLTFVACMYQVILFDLFGQHCSRMRHLAANSSLEGLETGGFNLSILPRACRPGAALNPSDSKLKSSAAYADSADDWDHRPFLFFLNICGVGVFWSCPCWWRKGKKAGSQARGCPPSAGSRLSGGQRQLDWTERCSQKMFSFWMFCLISACSFINIGNRLSGHVLWQDASDVVEIDSEDAVVALPGAMPQHWMATIDEAGEPLPSAQTVQTVSVSCLPRSSVSN